MPRRTVPLLAAACACAAGVAACGGSSHVGTTTKTQQTTTNNTTTVGHNGGHKGRKGHKGAPVTLTVRSATGGPRFSSSATSSAGGHVIMVATVGSAPPANVTITYPTTTANRLSLSATALGHTATATVVGANGTAVKLQAIQFTCAIPPDPSFCPVVQDVSGGSDRHVTFSTTYKAPVALIATIGPTANKLPQAGSGSTKKAPPYAVKEFVTAVSPGATGKPTYGTSATATKGDAAIFVTRVAGKVKGAPQPLTLTITQQGSDSIVASASIQGGHTSKATLKGSSAISLALPRFTCYLPPVASYCPPTSMSGGSHQYTLKFQVSPTMPPIVVQAKTSFR